MRKLKPTNSPKMPPQSATKESNGKASASFSILIRLVASRMEKTDVLGACSKIGCMPLAN